MIRKEITVWGIDNANYQHEKGDLLSIKDFPRKLGKAQVPPKFLRLVVEFANERQYKKFLTYLDPEYGPDNISYVVDVAPDGKIPVDRFGDPKLKEVRIPSIAKKKAWKLNIDELPSDDRDKLYRGEEVRIGTEAFGKPWEAIKNSLRRKVDNAISEDITLIE